MSSDPTQPVPQWRPRQDQETQRLPAGEQWYQGGGQGYQGQPSYQEGSGYRGSPPSRVRRRRRKWPWITLLVIVLVLVIGDRAACAITESQLASQVQKQGFPVKPHVTIEGIPFLPQLAARDFNTVLFSASNVTEGPLDIASLNATIHGMHINSSFNGATIDSINGSALITFSSLASAGGVPQGIKLSADGPNEVKATINVAIITATVVAQVTKSGPDSLNVRVVQAGDVPSSVLGNLADFTINVPKSALPAGLSIQGVSVTQQGVRVTVTGHDTTLSG